MHALMADWARQALLYGSPAAASRTLPWWVSLRTITQARTLDLAQIRRLSSWIWYCKRTAGSSAGGRSTPSAPPSSPAAAFYP